MPILSSWAVLGGLADLDVVDGADEDAGLGFGGEFVVEGMDED